MDRLTIFWVIQAAVFSFFFAELGFIASIWLKARIPNLPSDASISSKLLFLLRTAFQIVFSSRLLEAIKGLVLDGMLHRRLLHTSPLRWAGHLLTFGAFFLLGIFSIITGFASEILHHLLKLEHPLILIFTLPDHPFIALVNEVLGVILLAGLLVLFYRRFIARDPQLRTAFDDRFVIALLLAIVLSGFLLEAVRLLGKGQIGTAPVLGFIGYALYRLLSPVSLHWYGIYLGLFFFHFGLCDLLLLYLPFSKFAHVLAAPLLTSLNALESYAHPLEVTQ